MVDMKSLSELAAAVVTKTIRFSSDMFPVAFLNRGTPFNQAPSYHQQFWKFYAPRHGRMTNAKNPLRAYFVQVALLRPHLENEQDERTVLLKGRRFAGNGTWPIAIMNRDCSGIWRSHDAAPCAKSAKRVRGPSKAIKTVPTEP